MESLAVFLSLVYRGEVRAVQETDIMGVNEVCHVLGVDMAAVRINKSAPKDGNRKKRILLGGKSLKIEKEKTTAAPESMKNSPSPVESVKSLKSPVPSPRPSRSKKNPPSNSVDSESSVKYCLCREPERPGMIGCDYCEEWYHISCLNLKKEEVNELTKCKWMCPKCELKDSKNTRGML